MVAKIISGKSIRGMLHYNENKVAEEEAKLILASGFAAEVNGMHLEQKLRRFEHLTMLNGKVKTNAVHITLNFDGQDKLNNELLQQITITYMEKIGFGDQPYLVYKHTDAAHPHIHIVTTNMKADGKRIDLHNIGRNLSEPARKVLEKEYGLVKAEGRQYSNPLGIKPAEPEKAVYGKTPTKRAIANIVNAVVQTYKFTSLAEMNAVLKQFNITADRGGENTMMFQKKGLMYSMINEKGEQVGVPVKASSLYGKPILAKLENRFAQNEEKRKAYKGPLKEAIEEVFDKYDAISKATFTAELAKREVNVLFRTNEQSLTYGLTFIDNRNKTVFNGSDLGKAYSAKAVTDRLSATDQPKREQKTYLKPPMPTDYLKRGQPANTYLKPAGPTDFLKDLLGKAAPEHGPSIPRKKKRKKKGREQEEQLTL